MAGRKTKSKYTERVSFVIPPDVNNPEETEKVICVNGKNYQIQVGKTVEVPLFVKEAYDNSRRQFYKAVNKEKQFIN